MKILSLIIARAGSKGLPNKCLLPIAHKPVIEYTFKWITELSCNNRHHDVAISTDIFSLENLAKKYGIRFIKRPFELAEDSATVEDVIFHAINHLDSDHDLVALWMGNVPIRYDELFWGPLKFLQKYDDFTAVLTFQNVEKYNPAWMFPLSTDILPEKEVSASRRQDLPQFIIHDGHSLIFRRENFVRNYNNINKFGKRKMYEHFGPKIKPWIHKKIIVDIDTRKDFIIADAIIKSNLVF